MHLSGVTSCSAEDLARSLVAEVDLGKRRSKNAKVTSERVAFVTLRAVLPERLDGVPAKRIIELRERHAGARHAFHGYVEDVRAQLANADISEPRALDEHIRLEYRRRVEPELAELGRGLSSLGVGTFLGVFGVALTLPLGSLLGASPTAALAAASGGALGLAALAHKQRDSARERLRPSPASFLFLTEQLRHRALGRRVAECIRRFTLGV
jgi:hypothetical protein